MNVQVLGVYLVVVVKYMKIYFGSKSGECEYLCDCECVCLPLGVCLIVCICSQQMILCLEVYVSFPGT